MQMIALLRNVQYFNCTPNEHIFGSALEGVDGLSRLIMLDKCALCASSC
jgi:hypothetical protein